MQFSPSANFPKKQQGTILITVMLLFALGAYMATEITYRQKIDIQRTSSIFMQAQALEYVLAAEEIARFALRKDLEDDNKDNKDNIDTNQEDWAGDALQYPLDNGTIKGKLVDLQGRFNLNWLIEADAGRRSSYQDIFVSLLGSLGIPKEGSPQAVATQIKDWLDVDSDPEFQDGKEDSEYMLEEPPRRTGNRLFVDVSELMLISTLTPEEVEKLAPYVSVLPLGSELNVKTALADVVGAINCINTSELETRQKDDSIVTTNDMVTWDTSDPGCKNASQNTVPMSVTSQFYQLDAEAVIDGKTVRIKSILYRDRSQTSNIDVKVIYRKQVDPFSKV